MNTKLHAINDSTNAFCIGLPGAMWCQPTPVSWHHLSTACDVISMPSSLTIMSGCPLHRNLIPNAALVGACLLAGSDIVSRVVLVPQQLPVGNVTTSIGSLFVFLLLYRTARP